MTVTIWAAGTQRDQAQMHLSWLMLAGILNLQMRSIAKVLKNGLCRVIAVRISVGLSNGHAPARSPCGNIGREEATEYAEQPEALPAI